MSPAGYWPQLKAAIEAGADSVYFGLKHFTARAKVGFEPRDVPEVMRTLHQRGVKGYVTFNTLVFDSELTEAVETLARIADAGADAIIVQDIGAARLAREIAPHLEIHASTQMSITSAEGVALAQRFGISRVVLARELSLAEIRAIRAQTDCELEIFVHGALCVSYSGQCFSSEAWGGRSANRGQCAQACRLPYEMIVDGAPRPLGDARYLLSPGDLYTLPMIPEIVEAGVESLKIEGRYKDADYVALTTRAYRQAVDAAWEQRAAKPDPADELRIEQVYSRGLGPHFLSGVNHQSVVSGRAPRHRGVRAGTVMQTLHDSVIIRPGDADRISPLKPGDGMVFDAADWRSPQEREEGGRIYEVERRADGSIRLTFANGAVQFDRIRAGDWVWRSHDPDLDRYVKPLLEPATPVRRQVVSVSVRAAEGERLITLWTLRDRPEIQVQSSSDHALSEAGSRSLTMELLRAQLGRLGNTPYELGDIDLDLQGRPFVPVSTLNAVRRMAVDRLAAKQGAGPVEKARPEAVELLIRPRRRVPEGGAPPVLHYLVRTPEQLEATLELQPASVTLDYLELYGLRPSVELVQSRGIEARVASPRVLKPNEERIVHFLLKLDCPIVVRSTGLLHSLQGLKHPPLIGDFSLNAANAIAVEFLLGLGLDRVTPSHDLNAAQVADLAGRAGPDRLEVIAFQHLPVFHTEHCVFCRFLSTGTSFEDCGHPCEKHRVALRDERGREHPVMADVGCRNTVFGAEAQEASRHLDAWRKAGIHHFRLEFAHETAEQVRAVGNAWRSALDGPGAAVLGRELRRIVPQGATEGSLVILR